MGPTKDIAWIRDAIEAAAKKLAEQGARLREDAKYFLLVNFTEMVVKPLRKANPEKRLQDALNHDLKLLLDVAAQAVHKAEISGHAVVDALSKAWSDLEVNHLEIWN